MLDNNKLHTRDKINQAGVYHINCPNYSCLYVGLTDRSFDIRFKEHDRSWKVQKTNSSVANYLLENIHSCNVSNLKKFLTFMVMLESFEIRLVVSKNKPLHNDQLDICNSKIYYLS